MASSSSSVVLKAAALQGFSKAAPFYNTTAVIFSFSHTTMAMSYVSPLWFDLQEEFGDLAFGHNTSHEMICLPSKRFYCKAACYVGVPSLVGYSMHKS